MIIKFVYYFLNNAILFVFNLNSLQNRKNLHFIKNLLINRHIFNNMEKIKVKYWRISKIKEDWCEKNVEILKDGKLGWKYFYL